MYKVKESSGKSVVIKFSKQSEVNYQSVCILNETHPACLLPFDFQLKLFKIHMTYDAGELVRLSEIFKSQADNDTLIGLLIDIFNSVAGFSSTGLDVRGLVYRADCMFVNANGNVKMVYAPAFEYDETNTIDNFINNLLKIKAASPELCNMINQCYQSFKGGNEPPMQQSVNDFSEGETTVLSAQPMQPSVHDFSEGETTVLSAQPMQPSVHDFSEGETTVLSAKPMQPSVHDFSEGETTVLSAQPMQPSVHDFSEGETTVLSESQSPFGNYQSGASDDLRPEPVADVDDDFYNENETCLIDSDFDVEKPSETNDGPTIEPDTDSAEEAKFDYNDNHIAEEGQSSENYSENETTIPHFGNPLRNDRTLIGSEGLAHAMAYSAIQANDKAADSYETVLLADESTDKTAFFIRFINSQAVYVTKNYFTIGSGPDMDYMISGNSLVSKYHATIVIENSRFYIIDNKSTNKVYVDGKEAVPYEKNEIFTGSRIVLANEIFDFYIK